MTQNAMHDVTVFEYIIVGGGTAGLVIASRLAQNTKSSVLVLEAGSDISASPEIRIPGDHGSSRYQFDQKVDIMYIPASSSKNLGNPSWDWSFFSTPKSHADERVIFLPRGKSLGGSSNLNYMQINRSMAEEYDAFETLGIKGWSWNELLPYFKKSESLSVKPSETAPASVKVDQNVHGTSGPIQTTVPLEIAVSQERFFDALQELNVGLNPDCCSGNNLGACTSFCAIEPAGRTRVSSDTAYLKPCSSLSNLTVYTEAQATKILFKTTSGDVVAEAVEYVKDNQKCKAIASREVILCAGTYQTPQLLEQSGIGEPGILTSYGIEPLVVLPGVGTNLRIDSWDSLQDPAKLAEELEKYQTQHTGKLTSVPFAYSFLSLDDFMAPVVKERFKKTVEDTASDDPVVAKIKQLQLDGFDKLPLLEIMEVASFTPSDVAKPEEGKTYCSLASCLQRPLSYGTVHINSVNPMERPVINPNFFSNTADMELLIEAMKYCRKIVSTASMSKIIQKEVSPGPKVTTDEDLMSFIKRNFATVFHPIGTAAMLPREAGGVVDSELKVYGTANVRVMDASILPVQFSGHPIATIYAMAEKAADIIIASN
ncbi:alcohol oxidase [Dendrothele bispora CBS 962.96]|uniref:Alcohol oxidase n=1 Tax=Dendrothele bispora (strain CBS 962.96) TaxID=1314807 RepID=A0A4S8LK44_DENBC|nr:alcohol oxidase [Dendrothele bispora CBS 962.96]